MRKLAWIAAASAVLVLTVVLGVSLLDGHHSAFADTGDVNFDIDPLIAEDEDTDGAPNDGCPAFNAAGDEDGCGGGTCSNGFDDTDTCDGLGTADGADQNDADCIGTGAETACTDTIDNDGDGYVNDGCPVVGSAETVCGNAKNILGEVQDCVRVNGTTGFNKLRDYQIDAVVSGNTSQLFSYDAWVTYDNTRINVLDVGGVPRSISTIKNPAASNFCTDEVGTDARMSIDGRADCGASYSALPGTGWAGDGTILRLSLDIDFTNPGVVTFAFDKGVYKDFEGHTHTGSTFSGQLAINTDCPSANTAPVAADKTVTTNEDTPATVTLTATDVETCELTFSIITPPTNGILSPITNQACVSGSPNSDSALVAYTPAANYSGPDSFDYQVSDGSLTDTATVTVTVTAVNDPPNVTAPTTITTAEDSAATAPTTIADVDDTAFTCALVSGSEPAHGSVTFAANCASVTYTATELNYSGPDAFTFRVTDSGGGQGAGFKLSDDQPVSVTVTPVNDAPNVTAPTTMTVAEDSAATAPTTITDVDDTAFTCALVSGSEPAHGSVTFAANCASVTYTATELNYSGSDAFTFRVTDSGGGQGSAFKLSDDQAVSVTVIAGNVPPTCNAVSVTTAEDTSVVVNFNCSDPDNDPLTYSVVLDPTHGTLTGSGASRTYAPASNYNGPDSFTYKACDDKAACSDPATVSVTVTPVNDAPNVTAPTTITVAEDSAATASTTITDVDDTTFTCALVSGSEPTHGSVTFAANCASVTYTATQLNYNGSDAFTFRVTDSGGGQGATFKLSDDQPVSVTVTPVNDAPNVTAPTTMTVAEDSAATAPTTITDVDDTAFTCALVSGSEPAHGSVTFAANCASVTYTPNSNYYGSDAFTFRVTDSGGGQGAAFKLSDDQPVSVTITPVSDPPVAADVSGGNVPKDSTNNPWAPSVSDPDGGTLTCSILTQPTSGGTATVASNCSSGTYTPAAGFTGSDSFVYQVSDGFLTDTGTVTFTVTAAPPEELTIDIRPGSYPNTINLKSKSVIPVAILTTDAFDASDIDPASAMFEGASPILWVLSDVDHDGDLDLLLHFRRQDTSIAEGQVQACLTATPFGGIPLQGCDSIKVVPAKGAGGMHGGMLALGAPLGLLGIRLGRNALEKTRRRF